MSAPNPPPREQQTRLGEDGFVWTCIECGFWMRAFPDGPEATRPECTGRGEGVDRHEPLGMLATPVYFGASVAALQSDLRIAREALEHYAEAMNDGDETVARAALQQLEAGQGE